MWKKLIFSQRDAGGIIDIEAESKKFLIVTTSQAAGSDEGQSSLQAAAAAARFDSRSESIEKSESKNLESGRKHKGGSGMGKRRDYGEKKRNTRRRNWQIVIKSLLSTDFHFTDDLTTLYKLKALFPLHLWICFVHLKLLMYFVYYKQWQFRLDCISGSALRILSLSLLSGVFVQFRNLTRATLWFNAIFNSFVFAVSWTLIRVNKINKCLAFDFVRFLWLKSLVYQVFYLIKQLMWQLANKV
jgi:hypothetical protein